MANDTFFSPPFFNITDFILLAAFMSSLKTEINLQPASHIGGINISAFLELFLVWEGLDTQAF